MGDTYIKLPYRAKRSCLKHTKIVDENGLIKMSYHRTQVVSYDPVSKGIHLQTGGWDTVTTRRRMNQFAQLHNLNFNVWREDGITYVRTKGAIEEQFELGKQLMFTTSQRD